MALKGWLIVALVVGALAALGIWTNWNRDQATTIAEGEAIKTTVATTDKVQGIKNEIRKRPISDAATIKRLRDGTW